MKSCGLIVEYNPFHNGHDYHVQMAKKHTNAECAIAVMSGSFLQRGEPAIVDKFHRTKAALASGIDVVIELPYAYAVQSSELFAKGAVQTLYQIGVDSICFGSEQGNIHYFQSAYKHFKNNQVNFKQEQHHYLNKGYAFPEASRKGYDKIGLTDAKLDLTKPNNILGFSYVKEVMDHVLPIHLLTIKRTKSDYHDDTINSSIASATSIRRNLFKQNSMTSHVKQSLPEVSVQQLENYKSFTTMWHSWEAYFPLLHYRVMTMPTEEMKQIHGMNEGLEHRIKRTAKQASSFREWMNLVKTKRYTWTRLQRIFVHLLTNTKQTDIEQIHQNASVSYVRLLGITKTGQAYLNKRKKEMDVPITSGLKRELNPLLSAEERASLAYYSILPPLARKQLFKQEFMPPIRQQ
ncbi:nucleotidyltransferase [Virgibacillus sp. W0181]|uniref:nucleotidyltransferase n=1 Tax=Virgibacillus sp. W0181 TaxID=3391581 RepID=UPI003F44D52B